MFSRFSAHSLSERLSWYHLVGTAQHVTVVMHRLRSEAESVNNDHEGTTAQKGLPGLFLTPSIGHHSRGSTTRSDLDEPIDGTVKQCHRLLTLLCTLNYLD